MWTCQVGSWLELVGDELLDHLHKKGDLGAGTVGEVLGGADEHRDVPDTGWLAPVQYFLGVLGSVSLAQPCIRQTLLARLPAVAIHDDAHVPGQRGFGQLHAQPSGVQPVDEFPTQHLGSTSEIPAWQATPAR